MRQRTVFLLGALVLTAGCKTTPPPVELPPEPAAPVRRFVPTELSGQLNTLLKEPFSDTGTVEVLYATNRRIKGDASACDDSSFGVEASKTMSYGLCRLNVPKLHTVGALDVSDDPRADTHKYFRVLSQETLTEDTLVQALKARQPADVLVFVHGFNVPFREAVARAAQIAYDLKFQGPVVLFTWPAGASEGMFDKTFINRTYEANKANAANSVGPLAGFLKLLAGTGSVTHVMVHSMGHQVAVPALAQAAPTLWPFIGELILNAPDIPVKDFKTLAPKIKFLAQRITVYCSYNDNAIAASETYNKGRRMGGCALIPDVDIINVGEIDAPTLGIGGLGHGYYAGRPILTDVYQTLLGVAAEKRLFIRKAEPNSTQNFYLRP